MGLGPVLKHRQLGELFLWEASDCEDRKKANGSPLCPCKQGQAYKATRAAEKGTTLDPSV